MHYQADVAAYTAAMEGNIGTACIEPDGKPGTPAKLTFCTQPAGGTANRGLSAVVVQVQDAKGKAVTSATNAITISSTPAGVGGTTTDNAVAGVATFNSLILSSLGSFTLTATSPGLANATSSSITIVAAGSPAPAFEVDVERARYFRNKVAYNFMAEIDYVYGKYAGGLFSIKATTSLVADFESLGLTAASAISLAARTKTILASLATGVAGVNLSADKNFFGQQAFQALAIAMQARRDQARATVIKNLQNSVIDYPLAAVRRDLISYFYAGTLPGALQEIQEEASKSSADAAKKVDDLSFGAAAKLALSTQIADGSVDKRLPDVIVQVQDANGKVVTSATNSISISSTPEGVKGTTTANALAGMATFNNLTFSKEGSYTLAAAATGLTSASSNSFKIGAAGSPQAAPTVAVPPVVIPQLTPPNKQPSMDHLH